MFPDPCGALLAEAVRNGADPQQVVPDDFLVVRGSAKPIPPLGTVFSATVGLSLAAAACAVPHGRVRAATAGAIRQYRGRVVRLAEFSPHGTLNTQHVDVVEYGQTSFSEPLPNPVPKHWRIDAGA
jgi:hypothetical protein